MDLSGTQVSDAALASLEKMPPSLAQLSMNIERAQVSDAELASLERLPPSLAHLTIYL